MKKNIILINYSGPTHDFLSLFPDNGLALLAAVLEQDGYGVKILDFCNTSFYDYFFSNEIGKNIKELKNKLEKANIFSGISSIKNEMYAFLIHAEEKIYEEIKAHIINLKPVAVGFKIWGGFGTKGTLRLAKLIKRDFPGITIIGGGPQTEVFQTSLMEAAPQFDYIIYGEGEESLLQLLCALGKKNTSALEEISTLIYRDGNIIKINGKKSFTDLQNLPHPQYSPDIYTGIESGKIKIFLTEESRGCPNNCHFCIHPKKSGRNYRLKSIEKIEEELTISSNSLKSRFFRFSGSNPPPAHVMKLAPYLKENRFIFSLFSYVNSGFDPVKLKDCGCCSVFYGVESGSPYILDKMFGKKITPEQIKKALTASKKAGLFTVASLIVPTPLDTPETICETYNLIKTISPDSATVQLPLLDPETHWWEKAEEFGFRFSNKELLKKKLMYYENAFITETLEHLPYGIGNRTNTHALAETAQFISRLVKEGIPYGISDSLYLCAKAAKEDPAIFTESINNILKDKRADELAQTVRKINKNLENDWEEKSGMECCNT